MYATSAAMITRFGEDEVVTLTDRVGSGLIDMVVLDQALADACAMIDGYLASRYDLPLALVPPMLEPLCCDITRYRLTSSSTDTNTTDQIERRYKDALNWLQQVARGTLDLGVDVSGAAPPAAGGSTGINFVPGRARIFDAGGLGDFTFRGRG